MRSSHAGHEKASAHREHQGKREAAPRQAPAGTTEQLIFTVDTASGAVTKIEKIDAGGKRREMPQDETVALVGRDSIHEIEAALDEAFEAGISSVLGPDSADEPEADSDDDVELRKLLLAGMIGSEIRRKLRRRLVQRVILSRKLTH